MRKEAGSDRKGRDWKERKRTGRRGKEEEAESDRKERKETGREGKEMDGK